MARRIRVYPNTVNAIELMEIFEENKHIFKSISASSEYIDYCLKLALDLYVKEKKSFRNGFVFDLLYEKILNFNTFNLVLRFDISKAIETSKDNEMISMKINPPLLQKIEFNHITNVSENYLHIKSPIILVPYNLDGCDYLVIDGNHRLSAAIRYGMYSTNAVYLTTEQASKLFASEFEKLIYLFIQDGLYLSNVLQKNIGEFDRNKCMIEKIFLVHQ